jgi:hypothetical protein
MHDIPCYRKLLILTKQEMYVLTRFSCLVLESTQRMEASRQEREGDACTYAQE